MKQLMFVVLIGAFASQSVGCGSSRPASTPATGDACLVGSWSLDNEANQSAWYYANTPVAVSGLHGVRLTVGADGTETEIFAGSKPLVGALADGRLLSITIGGSFTFHLHGDGHRYVETGTAAVMPVTATVDGVAVSDYHGSYSPGTGTYTCSQRTLTTITGLGVQTDTWIRK